MNSLKLAGYTAIALILSSCSTMNRGGMQDSVNGSAGPGGSQSTTNIAHCNAPVGTIAVDENPSGYRYSSVSLNLPNSPVSVLKLLLQQSGCFTVVDRDRGLNKSMGELALQDGGYMRKKAKDNVSKGNYVEAHYTLVPDLLISDSNAGGAGMDLAAGVATRALGLPYAGAIANTMSGGMQTRNAQVLLSLIDNNTTVQLAAVEGSAEANDFNLGGSVSNWFAGGSVGASGGAWSHTAQGKVVINAFIDAINKLVPQMQSGGGAVPIPDKKFR